MNGHPESMSAGKTLLYVLQNNNSLAIIDIDSFTILKDQEFKDFEATSMVFNESLNEIWLGDKKGLLHLLDGTDLSHKQLIDKKHNHTVTCMAISKDGKLVASGDAYRYIYVFNSDTKEEVGCFTYHTSKIIHLDFNHDSTKLLTAGLDLTVGVANIAEKTKKTVHRPNEKELTCAVFEDDDKFYTGGYDCCIRLWAK